MKAVMFIALLISMHLMLADYLEVSRDAIIREDSLSSSDILERVPAGSLLSFVGEQRFYGTGYIKIRTTSGTTGFVYKSYVRIIIGAMPTGNGSSNNSATAAGGNLELHMINVGQGDAMIIRCPDKEHELLIDAAELNLGFRYPGSQTEFRNYMTAFQSSDNPIEVVVATHPHSDHIAGMSWVVTEYEVGLYVDNGMTNTSGTYRSLEETLDTRNINRFQLNHPQIPQIDFCPRDDVNAQILRPAGFDEEGIDPNNYSVIVRVDYGSTSFLFTGDAEKEMEDKLVADPATVGLIDVDFLKVGHHGSHSSSQTTFLDVVTPDIAAISCGAETVGTNDGHRHPRMVSINNLLPYLQDRNGMETTLEAYDSNLARWSQISTKKALYITNNDGDLIFLSDGRDIWRKGDR